MIETKDAVGNDNISLGEPCQCHHVLPAEFPSKISRASKFSTIRGSAPLPL